MLAAVLMIGTTLLLSPYMLIMAKHDSLVEITQGGSEVQKEEVQNARVILADVKAELARISEVVSTRSVPKDVLGTVFDLRPKEVSITKISYESEPGSGRVVLSGMAADRAGLLTFVNSLKNDPLFENIDDPRSNYTSPYDLDYSLVLTLSTS
jgi:Tfp pilus assembly protein PilN